MVLRICLFILMAIGLTGFGTVAWISSHSGAPAAQPAAVMVRVLAAAQTLRPGALLKPDDVTSVEMAQRDVPDGARIDTQPARAELLGAMVRRTVLANEPLLPAHVMRAGERGFLAAVLEPGRRAITVGVDAVSGTAGLIWPGDHVDLILTQTLTEANEPQGRRIAGETVLHNVRVIAIDQELMQGATAANNLPNTAPPQSRTVTLDVSPDNAERVAVATRLGHLSLSVISADQAETPAATSPGADQAAAQPASPVTWGGDVSAALQTGKPADPKVGSMRLYEGAADSKEIHF